MKTAICTIAKNENVYINDWVNYYLNIGFDDIYIYDNNDVDTPYVGDFIENKDNVVITNWHEDYVHLFNQIAAYKDFLSKYSSIYDWVSFIDVDEYIHLNCNSIQDWLSNAPNECNCIALVWKIYGDDGIVIGDESIPVCERFTSQVNGLSLNCYKSIIRTNSINSDFFWQSQSLFSIKDVVSGEFVFDYYDYRFNKIEVDADKIIDNNFVLENEECYIKHYMTKSISEFIKYKYTRWTDSKIIFGDGSPFDYFFAMNEKTQEKVDYIKEQTGIEIKI